MKTISKYARNIFLAVCVCVTGTSCEDFFDVKPYDFVAPETFYTNEKECTMALAGVYYTLVTEEVYGNFYSCMLSNVDDLSYYQRQSGSLTSQVYGNDHNPGNQNVGGYGRLCTQASTMQTCCLTMWTRRIWTML